MTIGLIGLAAVEFLYLSDAAWPNNVILISTVGIELSILYS
ncbi:MAG TPA: hypothetical protein VHF65_04065 [Nitrososphaera sp.]|nr:hypothetical protein [Nitrososphaera sp.]